LTVIAAIWIVVAIPLLLIYLLTVSLVPEDRTWNLVAACRKCNNEKRDRLTNIEALESLGAPRKKTIYAIGFPTAELAATWAFCMKKTSLTHPLRIAVVSAGPEFGRVGLTFCPGKYDRRALSGHWNRDLARDLDTIQAWINAPNRGREEVLWLPI
jgi:hypothetical protein